MVWLYMLTVLNNENWTRRLFDISCSHVITCTLCMSVIYKLMDKAYFVAYHGKRESEETNMAEIDILNEWNKRIYIYIYKLRDMRIEGRRKTFLNTEKAPGDSF